MRFQQGRLPHVVPLVDREPGGGRDRTETTGIAAEGARGGARRLTPGARRGRARALGLPALRVVETGGDAYASERQQWDSGNNAVAVEPGVVFAYDRNTGPTPNCARRAWRSSPSSAPNWAAAGAAATA